MNKAGQEILHAIALGGDKRSQKRNIKKAKEYWLLYKDSLKKK